MKKTTTLFLFFSFATTIILFLPIINLVLSTSPSEYWSVVRDRAALLAIMFSIGSATITTILAFILGIPLAYILARYEFNGRNIIEEMLDIPIMLPHTVAGIALLSLFGPRAPIGSALSMIGLYFMDTFWGIVLAQFFVSSPILIKTSITAFRSIDEQIIKVARSLGASNFRLFIDIELPLAKREITTGAILCWMRSISEFGAVIILAYYPMTAPVLIFYKFTTSGLSASRPIAAVLLLICLGIFVMLKYSNR
ncbi:MAG: ABC transporter permease [Candidatus Njordarchaeota archaeon]